MRHFYIPVVCVLSIIYALYVGDTGIPNGVSLCENNNYFERSNYDVKYPSIYSKLLLGCKFKSSDPDDKKALGVFYSTGTGHLLSISGLHLGGISLIIYLFVNLMFYLWSWKRKKQFLPFFKISTLISIIGALIYVIVIGIELPRLRALVMILLTAASMFFVVLRNKFIVLGVTMSTVLFIMPSTIYTYSFYYSFMCVLAIFVSPSKKNLNICMIIFVFILPLHLHSTGTLDFGSIISNFLVVPIFVFIYFPLQLFFFGLLNIGFNSVLTIMDHTTFCLLKILNLLDSLSGYVRIKMLPLNTAEVFLVYILLLISVIVILYKKVLDKKKVIIIYITFLSIGLFSCVYFYFNYFTNKNRIMVFDINKPNRFNGSGDLVFIQQGKYNILIDTGYGDSSVKKAVSWIRRNKVSTIDYLILSHKDIDHVGGLDYVLNSSGIFTKNLIVPPCLGLKGVKIPFRTNIYKVCNYSDIKLDENNGISFLHPNCSVKDTCSNNTALVSLFKLGNKKVVFTSDVSVRELIKIPYFGNVKNFTNVVLQLPHHCSSKENMNIILKGAKPISGFCTRANTLLKNGAALADYGFPVLMTGRCGNIDIRFTKDKIKISSQRCSKVYNFT